MPFLTLLGKQLKDDDLIDLLETWDIEVIYDFDRLHEGQPDVYWASCKERGFQFRFDAAQTLDTIFLHLAPAHGFAALAPADCDVPLFASTAEVQESANARGLPFKAGSADFLGVQTDWVRLEFGAHAVHYEFQDRKLTKVTLMRTHHV